MSTTLPTTTLTSTPTIALTTTFTPQPSCLLDLYQIYLTTSTDPSTPTSIPTGNWYLSLGPPYNPLPTSSTACYPPGWSSTSQYFSPGICPSGYSIAASTLFSAGTITETHGLCCPSSYISQASQIEPFLSDVHATDLCTLPPDAQTDTLAVTTVWGPGSTDIRETGPGLGINAYGVSVRWQSTDFQNPGATSTSKSASEGVGETSSAAAEGTSSASSGGSAGIGSGAKIGIAVGIVGFALLLLAGVGAFAWRRRREHARRLARAGLSDGEMRGVSSFEEGKYETSEFLGGQATSPGELDGSEIVELDDSEVLATATQKKKMRREPEQVHELG